MIAIGPSNIKSIAHQIQFKNPKTIAPIIPTIKKVTHANDSKYVSKKSPISRKSNPSTIAAWSADAIMATAKTISQ